MDSIRFETLHSDRTKISSAPIQWNTTVVDITYHCNATCKYCQWGNPHNPLRRHLAFQEILLSTGIIRALGTQRIVLSGGEPRLHPRLPEILSHYRKLVKSVIVMTNGYGLNKTEVSRLRRLGATGVTISLDSFFPNESMLTRQIPLSIHEDIINNLTDLCSRAREFELGINSVVSHVTANWKSVHEILEFGRKLHVDFIKFQPIFNDGYVEHNAPNLMLSAADSLNLSEIGDLLETIEHPTTNPAAFWKNISDLSSGKRLLSSSCNLGSRNSIAVRKDLKVCYWLSSIQFGKTDSQFGSEYAQSVRERFEVAKLECKVDFHCFCSQDIFHTWENRRGEEKSE